MATVVATQGNVPLAQAAAASAHQTHVAGRGYLQNNGGAGWLANEGEKLHDDQAMVK